MRCLWLRRFPGRDKSCYNTAASSRGSGVRPEYGTEDIVVGVLAALGVVVLIVVFVWVFREVMLKK